MSDTAADQAPRTRNERGHYEDCNYWDWPDFTKCECQAAAEQEPDSYLVAPMPLIDFFASQIDVPWDEAMNFATEMKHRQTRIETLDPNAMQPTLAEVCGARARLRYFEAAAMLRARELVHVSDKIPDEKPSDWVCVCKHEPERHKAVKVEDAKIEGGPCDQCECEAYRITETKRLSLVKEGHADDAGQKPLVSLT